MTKMCDVSMTSLQTFANDISQEVLSMEQIVQRIKQERHKCHCDLAKRIFFIFCSTILAVLPFIALVMIKTGGMKNEIQVFIGNILFTISYLVSMAAIVVIIIINVRHNTKNHETHETHSPESDEGDILIYSLIAMLGFGDSVFNINRY